MKLLYIAAPYRADTIVKLQHNIHEARKMAQYYWSKGYVVICPHLNSANFDGLIPDKSFMSGTKLMLSKCTHVAFHPKWSNSAGCVDEQMYSVRNKLTIYYTDMEKVNKFIRGL